MFEAPAKRSGAQGSEKESNDDELGRDKDNGRILNWDREAETHRHRGRETPGHRETGIQTEIEMKTYTATTGPPIIS